MARLGGPSKSVRIELPGDTSSSTATYLSAELSTINSQLLSHGWAKKPLNLDALSQSDHNDFVAVLFELLGASISNLNMLDTLNTRYRTLEYEYERLQKSNNSLKTSNAKLETDVTGWKTRCVEMGKRLALEETKTKELREENLRGKKALESVRVAAGHDAKKAQMSLDKALAQLTKVGNDSSVASKPQGLILLNPIPPGRIQPVSITHSPLLEQTLLDLTDIRAGLQEETEAFRHVVVTTGNALQEALAASRGKEPPTRLQHSQFFTDPDAKPYINSSSVVQSAPSISHPVIAQNRLLTLVEQIRARIIEGVPKYTSDGQQQIQHPSPEEVEEQKRAEREKEKKQRDLEDRIKDLEVDLECARKKEEEASRVIATYAKKQIQKDMNVEERPDDEEMERQKQSLDRERRRYAEEAVKLRLERQQLESERQIFLEEQRSAEKAILAASVPSLIPQQSISANKDEEVEVTTDASSSIWYQHRPQSPSPLSPHKPRTPKSHTAGGKRKGAKTPLSRLVLEKAVRQKGKGLGVNRLLMKEDDNTKRSVLGPERGRRTNAEKALVPIHSPSRKGKERSEGTRESLLKSSTLSRGRSLASSLSPHDNLISSKTPILQHISGASMTIDERPIRLKNSTMTNNTEKKGLGAAQKKAELTRSGGIESRAAVKKASWR
ncbi:uncharacterized protein L203_101836 [Cryptococcus depauperatus CBS 7841]|uniref:Uncharacterized protein n=1 Tax=Cryptococcus depauperatus CBS 7841 TaxID=1295531 RepID=A0A1E3IIV9_9TREE|nr:hypothetical protein L203_03079 [Cryptococcus depauperatus CBS 7841]